MNIELVKRIRKENPPARFINIRKGNAMWAATEWDGPLLMFQIPVSDMGEADFSARMDSKLLIRWLQPNEINFEQLRRQQNEQH